MPQAMTPIAPWSRGGAAVAKIPVDANAPKHPNAVRAEGQVEGVADGAVVVAIEAAAVVAAAAEITIRIRPVPVEKRQPG